MVARRVVVCHVKLSCVNSRRFASQHRVIKSARRVVYWEFRHGCTSGVSRQIESRQFTSQ
jgi:hypothetical protein